MNFFMNLKRRSASTSKVGASSKTAANMIKSTVTAGTAAGVPGPNEAAVGVYPAGAAAPADKVAANMVPKKNKYHRNSGVVVGSGRPPMITVNQMKSSAGYGGSGTATASDTAG